MERVNLSKKSSLKRELECYVVAWNTCLREAVREMDVITLLRNAHPAHRGDFAYKMRDEKFITAEAAKEFVKIIR